MESSGVGLKEADREIFNKLQLEQAELSTKFSNNVLGMYESIIVSLYNFIFVEIYLYI
jgi:Zn-dependent oligopeptidase